MSCFSSLAAATQKDCLAWGIPALALIASAVSWLLYQLWKHSYYRDSNFHLSFVNHPPIKQISTEMAIEPSTLKLLTCEKHKLCLRIHSQFAFKVQIIDVRFYNADLTPVERNSVEVLDITDPYYLLRRTQNGVFGIEANYQDRPYFVLARGAGFYLEIITIAHQSWAGYLGFRAQDDSGFRSYAKYAIAFGMTYSEAIQTISPNAHK